MRFTWLPFFWVLPQKTRPGLCIFVGLRCDEFDVRLFAKPKENGPVPWLVKPSRKGKAEDKTVVIEDGNDFRVEVTTEPYRDVYRFSLFKG